MGQALAKTGIPMPDTKSSWNGKDDKRMPTQNMDSLKTDDSSNLNWRKMMMVQMENHGTVKKTTRLTQ